jgi:Tetratricopeptide repeat/Glycosyltransferase family 9 (heptosyltransferase)
VKETLRQIALELKLKRLLVNDADPLKTLFSHSVLLLKQERYQEGIETLNEALLYAELPEIYSNLAFASSKLYDYDKAIAYYRKSLSLRPNHPNTVNDLSLELLRLGVWKEGWDLFEYRNVYENGFSDRYVKGRIPIWQGQDIAGKHIYISKEQGFGDAIQFIRYLPKLIEKADHVTWLCEPALLKLFQQSFDSSKVTFVDSFDTVPACDYWLYQMSLPRLVGEVEHNAYLNAYRREFHLPYGFKVGLAWKGNAKHVNDANRSLKLSDFDEMPEIQYVSLQKLNDNPYEIDNSPQNIIDIGSSIGDWDETAAVIDQLDLVICVDTAIAHLAGAMGKPCWVILPYYGSDWRWGPYGNKRCRLYKNTTLFWMNESGTVMTEIAEELRRYITETNAVL